MDGSTSGMSTCEGNQGAGMDIPLVLVATVTGRDAAPAALARMLNIVPGYRIRGSASSAGWLHLSEFAQRWLVLRDKGERPSNPDYIYFSQFRSTERDGFSERNSDFRPLAELLRRRIKPAWVHFFNFSEVLCGVRWMAINIARLQAGRRNGFVHALQPNEVGHGPMRYTVKQAIDSLRLFLLLFPRGKVVIHLPAWPLPAAANASLGCVCAGRSARCHDHRQPAAIPWASDKRAALISELVRFHWEQPDATFVTAANGFRNSSSIRELLRFLGESDSDGLVAKLFDSAQASRRRHLLRLNNDSQPVLHQDLKRPSERCMTARNESWSDWWCPPWRCQSPAAQPVAADSQQASGIECTASCPASLEEWAWQEHIALPPS